MDAPVLSRSLLLAGADPVWFAVAALGMEALVQEELHSLAPTLSLAAVPGGVEFTAPAEEARRLLPALRVTTRLWRRLSQSRARAFGELERKWAPLEWGHFVRPEQKLRVEVAVHQCRLYHTKALQQRLVEAVGRSLGAPVAVIAPAKGDTPLESGVAEDDENALRILVRGQSDVFTVSVDASGERLHRRGYRQEAGKAPLRETLAAGLLKLCGWTENEPLLDPMCGSGTLPIEAALMATGRWPPRQQFAMDLWPSRAGAQLPVLGRSRNLGDSLHIWGSDKDAGMVELARRNADRAGVLDAIRWNTQGFENLQPPAQSGLLLFNPPYGHRMAPGRMQAGVWRQLRTTIAAWRGWRAGVLVPKGASLEGVGVKLVSRHALRNGGLEVELLQLTTASVHG